jgi:L-ascorbate metabolism protein UlaG (beta-lactamase superfamily)
VEEDLQGGDQGSGSITFVGHATVLIELDGVRLLTDPVLGPQLFHLRRQVDPVRSIGNRRPDAVLISHQHHDHLDLRSLRRVGKSTRIIAPPDAVSLLLRKGFVLAEPLAPGRSTEVGPVTVRAVKAEHDGRRHPFGRSAEAIGFVVEGSSSIYFAGDTDIYPEMRGLVDHLDIGLIPVWGWGPTLGPGHLDPERAAEAAGLLGPRVAVPIHWGTLFPLGLARWGDHHLVNPPRKFASIVAERSPEVEVRVLQPGEMTSLG